jgi:hypothetical protein
MRTIQIGKLLITGPILESKIRLNHFYHYEILFLNKQANQ